MKRTEPETVEPAPRTILEVLAPVLTQPQLDLLREQQRSVIYLPGEYLYRQGDPAVTACCVTEGQVAIHQNDADGERRLLYVAQQGDILGLHEVIRKSAHANTAVAIGNVRCCSIPGEILVRLAAENPAMLIEVMRVVCAQIGNVEQRMHRAVAGR